MCIRDRYFAGKISPEALSAIAKSWPIYFIAMAVAIGIQAGTQALISNSIGAKEDKKASMYVAQSLVLAIIVSIFVTFFGLNFCQLVLCYFEHHQMLRDMKWYNLQKLYTT